MELRKEDIIHIASLAHIHVGEADVVRFQKELSNILGHIDTLKEVNVDGVEPLHQVTGLDTVTRADSVVKFPAVDDLVDSFPEHTDRFLKVTSVFKKHHG